MGISRVFLFGGSLALAAAVIWWWSTFSDVVQYGYLSWFEAGRCLASDSDLCALAKKLCLGAHPRGSTPYFAKAFWIAFGLLSASAVAWRASATSAASLAASD
jgi:hypothetical protein